MELPGPSGIAEIDCSRCHRRLLIDAIDLDVQSVGSEERQMGAETFYHGILDLACTRCGNGIIVEYEASEYPVGALNDSDVAISGAKLVRDFHQISVSFGNELYSFDDEISVYLPGQKQVITNLTSGVSDLIAAISIHPEILYKIDPRQFEGIIAEVFHKHDFDVELTPQTRDGGRDIVAIRSTLGVRTKYIIECKRYARTNPVSVGLVRQLYGVQTHEGANKSILATTSHFTSGAQEFASAVNTTQWAMDLKAYKDIVEWVRQTHKRV